MLVLYDKTESSFISNGLAILNKYCLSAVVREEVNNTFVLNAVFPSKFPHLDKIDYDRIIKAPTPDGEQPFRIYMIRKLFGRVYISAKHVFFDLEDNLIEDTFIQKQTGAGALNQILKSTQFTHKFSGTSDILNTNNSRLVDKNVVTALIGDQDNSFVNRWGGEIEVDKWDIRFNKVRGKDRGIQILYRKNLTGLDAILNKKTVCTRVLVKGYDGLTLPERYIDSPLINNYPNPIIQEIKFSNIKVKENEDDEGFDTKEEALEALREAGKQLFSIEHIDIPETSYTINFVELSKTEEYKKYKILETLWLGDTVTVKHDDLCIDVKARCVAYDFNSLTKKYINIELGKVKDNINKEINKEIDKIQEEIDDSKGFLDDAINAATDMINSGLGGYVAKTRDELLIMDTEDKMTASKVWRWNLNGLGFSKNGYLGPFETAITRDGKFVINSVTANKISGAMIEAGVLSSLNNRTWINLESGTFNFHDKMKFDGNSFELYLNSGTSVEDSINSKTKNLISGGNFRARNFEAWTNDKLNNISFYEGINGLTGIKVIDGTKEGWIVSNFIDIKSLQTNKFGLALNMAVESNVNSSQIYIQYYDISKKLLNEILLCDLENKFSGIKKIEDITIPPSVYYIAIRIDHNGLKNTSSNENTVVYIDYINFTQQKSIEGQLEDDGKIDSYFKMTSKELALKVGEDNISTLIEANPKSVQVAFNNINENIQNSQGTFSIKNGKLELYNNNGNKVFWVDTSGRTATDNLNIYGGERLGNIDIKGTGNKGIVIRSLDGGDRYIDFSTYNDDGSNWQEEIKQGNFTRLWAMGGDFYIMPTNKLFISSCNSKTSNSKLDEVVIKAVKTTIEGNLIPDSLNAVKSISTPSLTVNNIYSGSGWLILNSMSNFKNKVYCEDYLLTKKIGYGSNGGVLNKSEPITFYSPIELNNKNIGGVGTVSTTNLAANSSELNYAKINYLNGDLNCNQKQLYNIKYMNGDHLSASKVSCNELSGGSYFKILSSPDFNRNSINNVYRVSCTELAVSGSKNCVQDTESFGKRLINAYETADYLFGDIGESTIENGECIVWIDDIFKEIISTDVSYQVFLTKYGPGDIWVSERNADFFVVQAENDIAFGWEVKGKRKGYENYRLVEYKEESEIKQDE